MISWRLYHSSQSRQSSSDRSLISWHCPASLSMPVSFAGNFFRPPPPEREMLRLRQENVQRFSCRRYRPDALTRPNPPERLAAQPQTSTGVSRVKFLCLHLTSGFQFIFVSFLRAEDAADRLSQSAIRSSSLQTGLGFSMMGLFAVLQSPRKSGGR